MATIQERAVEFLVLIKETMKYGNWEANVSETGRNSVQVDVQTDEIYVECEIFEDRYEIFTDLPSFNEDYNEVDYNHTNLEFTEAEKAAETFCNLLVQGVL